MVHLPVLRLPALPRGLAGAHRLLALHAGVRNASRVLLLARGPAESLARLRVGVRPAEPHQHGDVQAEAEGIGGRWRGSRLGRSAHAHDQGTASPRLPSRRHQQLLRRHLGHASHADHDRLESLGALRAREPGVDRAARLRGAAPRAAGSPQQGRVLLRHAAGAAVPEGPQQGLAVAAVPARAVRRSRRRENGGRAQVPGLCAWKGGQSEVRGRGAMRGSAVQRAERGCGGSAVQCPVEGGGAEGSGEDGEKAGEHSLAGRGDAGGEAAGRRSAAV